MNIMYICRMDNMKIEKHLLEPFLPNNSKILFLGSFPPQRKRWSMDFFYPNFQNDMWKIMGLLFFDNKEYFIVPYEKRFNKELIVDFCLEKGLAFYDTATEVRRLNDNASDKYLEIVTPTDVKELLLKIPQCNVVVTTGQKATEVIVEQFKCNEPSIGNMTEFQIDNRMIHFWRMPSTSRAYPIAIEKKSEFYRKMFVEELWNRT